MAVQPVPPGFHTVTPYLLVQGVPKLIEFLQKGFGAEVVRCHKMPDGTVVHAQVRIGNSPIMMGETPPEWQSMPASLYLYVANADAMYASAIQAGAASLSEPKDEFYGDRVAGVRDPVGNLWWIATHIEDISDEELSRRAEAAAEQRDQAPPPNRD